VNVVKEIENVPVRTRLVGLEDTKTVEPGEIQLRVLRALKDLQTHPYSQHKIGYISGLLGKYVVGQASKRIRDVDQAACGTHPAILVKSQ
jgi:hypothetical protein